MTGCQCEKEPVLSGYSLSASFPTAAWASCLDHNATVSLGKAVGNCIESLAEIQVDNVLCSPCINQAGYFVREADQVCQA